MVPPRKRSRGAKDDQIIALEKLESRRRCPIFGATSIVQSTTGAIRATVPTVESQQLHQHSTSLAVPDNPLSPPTNDCIGVDQDFDNTPVRPDMGSQPSSHRAAGVLRNNDTLLHQTYHLGHTSLAWNTRRNNQATQWKSVVIPQLVTVYLANRAETESGRVPPSPLWVLELVCGTGMAPADGACGTS